MITSVISSGRPSQVNTELTEPSRLGIIYRAEPSNTEPSLKEYHFCPNISYFILKCILYTLIAILLFSNHSLTSIREKFLYKKVFFTIFWQKTVLFISKNDYNFSKARLSISRKYRTEPSNTEPSLPNLARFVCPLLFSQGGW